MNVAALIPIKLNSSRLPQKNIRPLYDGTPLMTFIQKTCLASKLIDEVYVYCSDEAVRPYVLEGVQFLKRPDYLNNDSINANDIIREFMKSVDADIYVNTHTTSPFAEAETLDDCISQVMSGEYDSAFCAERIRTFMWSDGKPLNFDPSHFPRTQDLPVIFAENSIAYVFTRETFRKYNRRVGDRPYIHEAGKVEAIDIDYPEDFMIADAVYRSLKSE